MKVNKENKSKEETRRQGRTQTFRLRSKHGTTLQQAGTGGTHQPELTIFWAFYFTGGEQNMEGQEGRHNKKRMNKQKIWKKTGKRQMQTPC